MKKFPRGAWRTERRSSPVGLGWVRAQTKLNPTPCCFQRGTWRVATRVAVPCVFRSQTPFAGDHGAVICVPSRSGSLAVSLKTRVQQYLPGSYNQYRIQIDSGALQDFGVGEALAPVVSGGSQVRVRMLLDSLGRHRAACSPSGEEDWQGSGRPEPQRGATSSSGK